MHWTVETRDVTEIVKAPAHGHVLLILLITSSFALAGRRLRGVTLSGAVAGFAVAFLLYSSAGPGAFALLVALFAITFLATRLGRSRKQSLGTAERSEGRGASQVLANVGVAALFAISYKYFPRTELLAACVAALTEAAADTVSSECGQALSASVWMVTTGARVPVGSNGGISLPGTFFGALAAFAMALSAVWLALVPAHSAGIITAAAFCGMFVDSLLGALLEAPGRLNNDAVNLLGTLSAALLALWWTR